MYCSLAEMDKLHQQMALTIIIGLVMVVMALCGCIFGVMPSGGRGYQQSEPVTFEAHPIKFRIMVFFCAFAGTLMTTLGGIGYFLI